MDVSKIGHQHLFILNLLNQKDHDQHFKKLTNLQTLSTISCRGSIKKTNFCIVLLYTDLHPPHGIPSNAPVSAQTWAVWSNICLWSQLFTDKILKTLLASYSGLTLTGLCCLPAAVRGGICRKPGETLKKETYRERSSPPKTPLHNFTEKKRKLRVGEGKHIESITPASSLDFERI